MEGAWIMYYHIPDDKSQSDLRDLHELRRKRLVAQVNGTRRFVLYLQTGEDLMLQLESSWHGRSVDLVLPCSRRQNCGRISETFSKYEKFMKVVEIQPRFLIRNMLIHDPRSSHAITTPIGASNPLRYHPRSSHAMTTPIGTSNPLRFQSTMRTDVFHSLVQQVFCLVIREGF
ncbi:uncharacterized protein G2W53_009768 [Senna tora]|uniref:Uncharacterized protein n=1 Tax=Senna tora TaxID=362788 RepID=A0A834WYI3_9FABA|nr:uncharacterized protein G2W53_009768 [Senna tora]